MKHHRHNLWSFLLQKPQEVVLTLGKHHMCLCAIGKAARNVSPGGNHSMQLSLFPIPPCLWVAMLPGQLGFPLNLGPFIWTSIMPISTIIWPRNNSRSLPNPCPSLPSDTTKGDRMLVLKPACTVPSANVSDLAYKTQGRWQTMSSAGQKVRLF